MSSTLIMAVCIWRCSRYPAAQALWNLARRSKSLSFGPVLPIPHPTCSCSPSVIYPCDHSQLFIGWHHEGICPIGAVHSYKHKQSSILMIQNSVFLSVRSQWEILHWVLLLCLSSFSYLQAEGIFSFWGNYSGCRRICCCLRYFVLAPLTRWPANSVCGSVLFYIHMQLQHWHTGHGFDM